MRASNPQGSPGDPILFLAGGCGLENTLPPSVDPMACKSGMGNLSRNCCCKAGDSGADEERKKRICRCVALRSFPSFESTSSETMVGTSADQVMPSCSTQS